MTRLRLALARGASLIGAILLWTWVALREALSLVGATTVGDDWDQLVTERIPAALGWLFSTPSYVPAVCAIALTLLLAWLSWPRRGPTPVPSPDPISVHMPPPESDLVDPWESETEEEADAKDELVLFYVDALSPALNAQSDLQEKIVRCAIKNDRLADLAVRGVKCAENTQEILASWSTISDTFSCSPQEFMSLDDLVRHIRIIRNGYQEFCHQADELFDIAGDRAMANSDIRDAWKDWVIKHNRLIDKYEAVRRGRRFLSLYRPTGGGEWGPRYALLDDGE